MENVKQHIYHALQYSTVNSANDYLRINQHTHIEPKNKKLLAQYD